VPFGDCLKQVPSDVSIATAALYVLQPVVTFVAVCHEIVSVFGILQEVFGMFPRPGRCIIIEDDRGFTVLPGPDKPDI
jgi:hypothetical protein